MGISYKNFGTSAKMSGMRVLPPQAINKHYSSVADPHWSNVTSMVRYSSTHDKFYDYVTNTQHTSSGGTLDPQSPFGSGGSMLGVYRADESIDLANYTLDGDFTIEFWLYYTSAATFAGILFDTSDDAGAATGGWWLYNSGVDRITMYIGGGPGYVWTSDAIPFTVGEWHHMAFVRNSGDIKLYCNGVNTTSTPFNYTDTLPASQPLSWTGTTGYGLIFSFKQPITECRLTKGVARYTADFTPPTEQFPTPALDIPPPPPQGIATWANVSGLFSFDGDFTDSTGKSTATPVGGAVINSGGKWGSNLVTNGTSTRYVSVDFNGDTASIANPVFTWEMWVYPYSQTHTQPNAWEFASFARDGGNYWNFGKLNDGTLKFYVYNGANRIIESAPGVVTTDEWQHIAVTCNGTTLKLWHNGTEVASGDFYNWSQTTFLLGEEYLGKIDELRVTTGEVLYTSSFTPPTDPFPTS